MKNIKYLMLAIVAIFAFVSFTACSSDDDDSAQGVENHSYQRDDISVDGDGNPEEYHVRLTFKSSSTCEVKCWGYDWIWYTSGYKKNNFNETKSCSYSVSGNTITLHNYPFYASGGNLVLTNYGSYLQDKGGDIYTRK